MLDKVLRALLLGVILGGRNMISLETILRFHLVVEELCDAAVRVRVVAAHGGRLDRDAARGLGRRRLRRRLARPGRHARAPTGALLRGTAPRLGTVRRPLLAEVAAAASAPRRTKHRHATGTNEKKR